MSIKTAVLAKGSTASFTGGTPVNLVTLGQNMNECSVVFDGTSILTRSAGQFLTRQPTANAGNPSGYSQARANVNLRFPKVLANGETVWDTVRISFSSSVETTTSEKNTIRNLVAQIIQQADFDGFWNELVLD